MTIQELQAVSEVIMERAVENWLRREYWLDLSEQTGIPVVRLMAASQRQIQASAEVTR